jgi:hypothetical protein
VQLAALRIRLSSFFQSHDFALAAFAYSLITAAIFFRVFAHFNSSLIGPSVGRDKLHFVWTLWLFGDNVIHGLDPGFTEKVFAFYGHPIPLFYNSGLLVTSVGAALSMIVGPLAAYNLVVLAPFPLSGLAVYLAVGEFVSLGLARFVAGFIYTFSTFHLSRAFGHIPLLEMEWAPFFVWRLWVFLRTPTPKNAIWCGVTLGLLPLSSLYYAVYFFVPFAVVFTAFALLDRFVDRAWFNARHLRMAGMACLVALALSLPVILNAASTPADVQTEMKYIASNDTASLGANTLAFFLPVARNPLLGRFTAPIYSRIEATQTRWAIENSAFLGVLALLLGFVAFARRDVRCSRWFWFWATFGLVGILVTIGPTLHVGDRSMPNVPIYQTFFGWPGFSMFRAPNRAIIGPFLAVAVISAMALSSLWAALGRSPRSRLIFVAAAIVGMFLTYATNAVGGYAFDATSVHIPDLYRQIGKDRSDSILLDLPALPYDGEPEFFQIFHHKRVVTGYVPRMTPAMLLSATATPELVPFGFTQSAGINLQGAVDMLPPRDIGLRQRFVGKGVRYVVFHHRVDPESDRWAMRFLRVNLGAPFYEADRLTAWRLTVPERV